VIFILGSGRSGSTLVANLLGSVEGVTSVGELRFLWSRGLLQNRKCGCGEPFDACPFWRDVMADAYAKVPADARRTSDQLERVIRMRRLPRYLRGSSDLGQMTALSDLVSELERVYRAISERQNGATVVDSSKLPTFAYLVAAVPSVDVTFVHLIRDPRAVAYSWQRVKALPDVVAGGTMQRLSVVKSSSLWNVWNATAYGMRWRRRYMRIRYEDFVAAPQVAVREMLDLVGAGDVRLPFDDAGLALLGTTHTVAGNPSRMVRGPVAIRPDSEWEAQLPPWQRRLVTTVTAPLLPAFGYRLSPLAQSR
jgi:sulfotransferase family protein